MTKNEYNGWHNWETWSFNLHWDQSFQEQAQECFNDSKKDTTFSREENATFRLADIIKETAEEVIDAENEGMKISRWMQGMINGYMSEVNFRQIAEGYIDGVDHTTPEPT